MKTKTGLLIFIIMLGMLFVTANSVEAKRKPPKPPCENISSVQYANHESKCKKSTKTPKPTKTRYTTKTPTATATFTSTPTATSTYKPRSIKCIALFPNICEYPTDMPTSTPDPTDPSNIKFPGP